MDAKQGGKAQTSRAERLESQLRVNLKRRKDQARARAAGRTSPEGVAGNNDNDHAGAAGDGTASDSLS